MKRVIYLLLFFFLSFSAFTAKATHMVGADLQVFATSTPKQYNVRLTIYRDCNGIPICSGSCDSASCGISVSITGMSGTYTGTSFGNVDLHFKSVEEARSHLCPTASTICDNMGCKPTGTLSPGIEKYTFEGIVNLEATVVPTACEQVSISWTSCCRNGVITTGSAGEGFYIEAIINKNLANSTPQFSNEPFFVLCGGVPFTYNMGGWDVDGDSLSYSFAPSLQGQNTPVDYIPPYSYATPLPWTGPANGAFPAGIKCDATTGDIMFTPVNGGSGSFVGVAAVEVTEWRKINGVNTIVSKTSRDFQAWIISCGSSPNNAPRFTTSGTSLPNKAIYNWNVCEGSSLCFDIIAKDTDATDTTTLVFDSLLIHMGATITPKYSTRQREDAYTFCWTPPAGTANSIPYYLFPTATDNKCPYIGKAQRAFSITVSGPGNVQIQKNIQCDYAVLTHTGNLNSGTSRQWKVSLTPGVYDSLNLLTGPAPIIVNHFLKAGKYPVRLYIVDTCLTRILYDTIVIKNAVDITDDTSFCFGNHPLTLKPKTSVPAAIAYKWYLLPDSSVIVDTFPQLHINASSNLNYVLRVTDTSGCTYHDYINITVSTPNTQFSVNNAQQCQGGNNFVFVNQSLDSNGFDLNYQWNISDGSQSSASDTLTKTFNSDGTYTVKLKATSIKGCVDSIVKIVAVHPMPKAVFVVNDSIQCKNGNQFTTTNNSTVTGDSLTYEWNFGNNSVSSDASPVWSYQSPGTYSVRLLANTSNGCKDSIKKIVIVNASPVAGFNINRNIQCYKDNLFTYTSNSSIPGGVGTISNLWNLGDGNASASTSPQYQHSYSNPGLYRVSLNAVTDNGCVDSIAKQIIINPSPIASFLIDAPAKCVNDVFAFTNTSVMSSGGLTMNWNTGDNQFYTQNNISHAYNSDGNYTVQLIVASDSLCYDTIAHSITVYEKPSTPVISGDIVAVEYSSKTYSVPMQSNSTWQWFVQGDTSHSSTDNMLLVSWGYRPEGGLVEVIETNEHGCSSDTSSLAVNLTKASGIPGVYLLKAVQFYPVPAKDVLYFSSPNIKINRIKLYNLEGKELVNFSQEDIQKKELPLKNILSGIYLLKLESDGNSITRQISIVR